MLVEFRAGEGVAERHLNGLHVQLLGEVDALAQGLARFARQTDDKIAMNHQAQLVAILGKAHGHVDGGALFDVPENLLVAGFIADNQQTAAGVLHRLQRFVIGGDARGAAPGEVERPQLL